MNKVNSPVGHAYLSIAVVVFLFFSVLITSCKDKKDPASPAPTITSLTPDSGLPGIAVTITGTHFNADKTKNTVKFGSTPATVSAATETALTVQAPGTLTVGAVKVTVSTSDGNSNEAGFTVLAAIIPPQITSFSPDSVSKGQTLTITGTNLNDVDSVVINGVKQTIGTKNATTITLNILPKTFSGRLALYKGGTATYHNKNVGYKETYAASQFSSYGKANAISIDKNGNIYLATNRAILKLTAAGTLIDTLVKQDTTYFTDILARSNGDVLITGQSGGSIMKITGKNQLQPIYSYHKMADIRLTETANQEVFFCTSTDAKIYKLNNGSPMVFTVTSPGQIEAIASDAQNNIFSTIYSLKTLVKYNSSGITTELAHYPAINHGDMGIHPQGMIYSCAQIIENRIIKYVDANRYFLLPTIGNSFQYFDLDFSLNEDMIACSPSENYLIKIIID